MERCLSELPGDIIHSIITNHLLNDPSTSNKTALQLGLLSKDISRAVQRRPVLRLEWNVSDPRSKSLKEEELKYLVSTLIRYKDQNIPLGTFQISMCDRYNIVPVSDDYSNFDRCIQLAATNGKGLVSLNMQMWAFYVWPEAVLRVESLVQLDLTAGFLAPVEGIIKWPNLKRLHLCGLIIGEGVFENMIKGCPVIEILEIVFCFFDIPDFHIKLFNLCYLKKLDIQLDEFQTFQVDSASAPNLESLGCAYHHPDYPYRVNLGKCVYHKLRTLIVSTPKAFSADFLTNMELQFPRLQELSIIFTNPDIKRINISSSTLKEINLMCTQRLEEVTLDVPNILVFSFYLEFSNVFPNLSLAGNPGGWISRIKFPIRNANINTLWLLNLKKFLGEINMAETSFTVAFNLDQGVLIIESNIVASTSSPENARHLTICRYRNQLAFSLPFARKVLDGIFPICSPQKITLVDWHDSEFPKLIYDYLMRLANLNFQQLMWNVSQVERGSEYENPKVSQVDHPYQGFKLRQVLDSNLFKDWSECDNPPQVLENLFKVSQTDREYEINLELVPQVLDKLFKVDHHGRILNIVFELEHFWKPKQHRNCRILTSRPLSYIFRRFASLFS